MTFFGWARRSAVGVVLCLGLSGCLPAGDSQLDEKKDPHFITGKNLVSQMDWQGAIDAFEKALDSNPRSASAHFELGWLCEEKVSPPDPASAIYHYDQYLKLSANPDKADLVRQHINSCKLELVKSMSAIGPLPSGAQRELERVLAENKDLQGQITQLQAQLAQWKAAAAANRSQPTANPPGQGSTAELPRPRTETPHPQSGQSGGPVTSHVSNPGTARTHIIKSHETMAGIARQYGVSLPALESANPQARPAHLQVGQTLKIPTP